MNRSGMMWMFLLAGIVTALPWAAHAGSAAVEATGSGVRYDVCDTCKIRELDGIPWSTLRPGSVVNVFARSAPYRTKLALSASGTAAAPIVINGVADGDGRLPVLTGQDAATPPANRDTGVYNDDHPEYGEALALILIKRTRAQPYGYKPSHIQIRNLELRGTYGATFTSQRGKRVPFAPYAAGIWADVVEDLSIDNCVITDHAFGVFVNNRNAAGGIDAETSRRVTIRNSRIFDNGRVGSYFEHNVYVQADGAVYEGNFIGRLRNGALGSSLKDRSAGTVVRFNRIECAARCLDLVHDESGSSERRDSPTARSADYDRAWVYGNVIESALSTSAVHFGGDNLGDGAGPFPTYRNGPLYFFNNTVVLRTADWRAQVFDIQHVGARVLAANNVISIAGSSEVRSWLNRFGELVLIGGNWTSSPLADTRDGPTRAEVQSRAPAITTGSLDAQWHVVPAVPRVTLPPEWGAHAADRKFVPPSGTAARSDSNIGAL